MEPMELNDGLVDIYGVENTGENGNTPVETLSENPKERLRYRERTIGVKRHYEAMQAKERVDLLIRVPFRPGVRANDVAIPTMDGAQYLITLVQRIEGTTPPLMDLTLRRLEREYEKSDTGA